MKQIASQLNLKKRYQIAFRRWLTCHAPAKSIVSYIGADIVFVRGWIMEKWLPGMHWNNYGDVWVIDHIVPVRLFDFSKSEDLRLALHYKNIMPLFKEDNLYKEGNISFSLEILKCIPSCEITEGLNSILLKESHRMDKYLIHKKAPIH
jgi:hypothetical protein